MGIEITPLFLVVAGVVGLLLGLLLANLFPGKETKSPRKKLPPGEILKEGFVDEARLWYSASEKKVITELDGEFHRDNGALSREQKKKVYLLASLWQEWVGSGSGQQVDDQGSSSLAEDSIEKENKPVPPFTIDLHGESTIDVAKQPDELEITEDEGVIASASGPTVTERINGILQELMEGTALKEEKVRLVENEQEGVDVWVGDEKFDGVDSVPYPQVRALIRTAVKRWQQEASSEQQPGE